MAGFLYYLPQTNMAAALTSLGRFGLTHLSGLPISATEHAHGPDGTGGAIAGDSRGREDPGLPVGFYPARQTWKQIAPPPLPGSPAPPLAYWIGWENQAPPRPEDLARREQLPGHWVRLGDGEEWLIPVAIGMGVDGDELVPYRRLPSYLELGPQGKWEHGAIVEQYTPLWDLAAGYFDSIRGLKAEGTRINFDFEGAAEAAIRVLGFQYHVGAAEVSLLRLLRSDRGVHEILRAVIDWPLVEEHYRKKKAQPTESPDPARVSAG